ncbi:glucuronyl esterase domain-containing protein [Puia dinghuensis]|nr:sialate O-acetylesterase [Puia dinghuensis]
MRRVNWLVVALLLLVQAGWTQVRLPQLIGDGMVLQRDRPVEVWGWAAPGERVRVRFDGETRSAVTDAAGAWSVRLAAKKAGGPYTMEILGSNRILVKDVLVGDVWFCSGQSNMVIPMERVKEKYPEAIAGADLPQIRNFFVPTVADVAGVHADLPASKWMEANPVNVLAFGAASYFFARQLYQRYHVPIGIINSSVGGTPIQAWISAEGFHDLPAYAGRLAQFRDTGWLNRQLHPMRPGNFGGAALPGSAGGSAASGRDGSMPHHVDLGLAGPVKWYDVQYVPEGWHSFWLPGYWADQGVKGLNGIVWFRREIDVPASMAGKAAKLFVGRIIDADETYLNGVKVGNITYQYPPRRYEIPAGLLKAGKNVLVVRVTNTFGKGGFVPDKRYELTDGATHIDIRGDWQYKVGAVFPPRSFGGGARPFSAQDEPTGLYNTMVAAATSYAIKGFLWYQGEANTGNPREYRQLLPALIADWRNKWRLGDLPFLYVQLPNFMEVQYSPAESQWAELREAQLDALGVVNTAMVVTIDIGEWNDIHPLDKKDVGDRLALAAENIAYGEKGVVGSGAVYQSAKVGGDSIVISFTSVGGGLVAKGGGPLQQFAIAGADRKFVWAKARIEGSTVVVSSDEIPHPWFVRYAWSDNPEGANLYNKEGLPASPFRTDRDDGKYPLPVTFTAQEDHDNMMQQLGIRVLRPGPSGDEKAPDHANYDEALANPYPDLPDVLTLKDGSPVTTPDQWWKLRRPEIVAAFETEVYGRVPANEPRVTWTVAVERRDSVGGMPVVTKQLVGHVDNSAYPLIDVDIKATLVLPANAKVPSPVLMLFGRFALPATTQQLIADGWGYLQIDPNSIQADNGAGLTRGIIGLVNKGQPRKPDDWGALRAWAWGAARALDYLEANEPMADSKHVGIEGVSRYGKAALVTLAFESRFAMGLIGSSGEGGAKLNRRNWGESVENITGGEFYWMAGNFMKYGASDAVFGAKTAKDLPVDAHELIALCAPRLTFISYGVPEKGDAKWLDHQGSYMATVAAGVVFKLLGAKDLGVSNDYKAEKMPPVNTGLLDGQLAWRQHDGGHTDAPNVKYFIEWVDKNILHAK